MSLPVLVHLPRLVVVVFLVGHARCVVVLDKVLERYHHLQARGERGERRRQGKKGEEGGGEGRKGEGREGKGNDGKGREMEGREGRSEMKWKEEVISVTDRQTDRQTDR